MLLGFGSCCITFHFADQALVLVGQVNMKNVKVFNFLHSVNDGLKISTFTILSVFLALCFYRILNTFNLHHYDNLKGQKGQLVPYFVFYLVTYLVLLSFYLVPFLGVQLNDDSTANTINLYMPCLQVVAVVLIQSSQRPSTKCFKNRLSKTNFDKLGAYRHMLGLHG